MRVYKNLKKTGIVSSTFCCGDVNFKGNQLSGCGKKPEGYDILQCSYTSDDYMDALFHVYLCEPCAEKYIAESRNRAEADEMLKLASNRGTRLC